MTIDSPSIVAFSIKLSYAPPNNSLIFTEIKDILYPSQPISSITKYDTLAFFGGIILPNQVILPHASVFVHLQEEIACNYDNHVLQGIGHTEPVP